VTVWQPVRTARRLQFVGVGSPHPARTCAFARGQDLSERRVGEIWVRSDSLMEGYYDDTEATSAVLKDGWLDTGDLGYLAGGTLFVTGRKKDLIIAGGRNLIPSAIEEIVSGLPGVRSGCVAAVGVPSEERQTEQVCIVAETRSGDAEHPHLSDAVRDALKVRGIGVDRSSVAPGTIRDVERKDQAAPRRAAPARPASCRGTPSPIARPLGIAPSRRPYDLGSPEPPDPALPSTLGPAARSRRRRGPRSDRPPIHRSHDRDGGDRDLR
jgi:hypothetical protein